MRSLLAVIQEPRLRLFATAMFAGLAALATGIASVIERPLLAPGEVSMLFWLCETVLVLSGAAIVWHAVRGPDPVVHPPLVSVFSTALLIVLTHHLAGLGDTPDWVALRFAAAFAIIFIVLPQEPKLVVWVALTAVLALTMALAALPGEATLSLVPAWTLAASVLGLSVGIGLRRVPAGERPEAQRRAPLAIIGHELRTPVNAVTGLTELMARHPAVAREPGLRELVGHLSSAGRRLARLTDDLAVLGRFGVEALPLAKAPVDLAPVLAEIAFEYDRMAREYGVALDCPPPPAEDCHVLADRVRLSQVLGNLVSNAIKFNHAGGKVSVGIARRRGVVEISVSDTGRGISQDQRAGLFTLFGRPDHGCDGPPGEGIGLALSRILVEAMDGRLRIVETGPGGSVFAVVLPVADAPAETSSEAALDPV